MCYCVCSHVPLFDFELRPSFATPALLVSLIDFPPSFLLIQLVPLPLFKRCLFCALYQFVAQFLMRSSACASLPVSWILPVPLCLFFGFCFLWIFCELYFVPFWLDLLWVLLWTFFPFAPFLCYWLSVLTASGLHLGLCLQNLNKPSFPFIHSSIFLDEFVSSFFIAHLFLSVNG